MTLAALLTFALLLVCWFVAPNATRSSQSSREAAEVDESTAPVPQLQRTV